MKKTFNHFLLPTLVMCSNLGINVFKQQTLLNNFKAEVVAKQQSDVASQINLLNESVKNYINKIDEILSGNLLLTNRLNRIVLIFDEIKKNERKIDQIYSRLNKNQAAHLFNDRWEILSERIADLERMASKYLVEGGFAEYEVRLIWNKIYTFIDFYQEILNNYNEEIDNINYRINISHFKDDYSYIKDINFEAFDEDSIKKGLNSLVEINKELKVAINDSNTRVSLKNKERLNDKIEYNLIIEINANKSKKYIGKLDIRLKMIKPMQKFMTLINRNFWTFKFDRDNNWYAGDEKWNLFFGNDKQIKKELNSFYNLGRVTAIEIDNNNNWYATTYKGGLYYGKTKEYGKNIATLNKTAVALKVDKENNWYAGTYKGSVYYGKSGSGPSTIQDVNLARQNVITSIGIDLNNNWYAATAPGFMVSGNSGGQKGKKINFLPDTAINANVYFDFNKDSSYWHAAKRDGRLYYGETGKVGKNFFTLPEDYDNRIKNLKVDKSGNWYAITNGNKLYSGRPGEPGKVIADFAKTATIMTFTFDKYNNLYLVTFKSGLYQTEIFMV